MGIMSPVALPQRQRRSRTPNRGQNPVRQQMAPQPDAGNQMGTQPRDRLGAARPWGAQVPNFPSPGRGSQGRGARRNPFLPPNPLRDPGAIAQQRSLMFPEQAQTGETGETGVSRPGTRTVQPMRRPQGPPAGGGGAGPPNQGDAASRPPAPQPQQDPERPQRRSKFESYFRQYGIPATPDTVDAMTDLEFEYEQALMDLRYDRDTARALTQVTIERLFENQLQEQEQTNEAAAERGVFNSGMRIADQAQVQQQYGRQFGDLATQEIQNTAAFRDARARLWGMFQEGIQGIARSGTREQVGRAASGSPFSGLRTTKGKARKGQRRGKRT